MKLRVSRRNTFSDAFNFNFVILGTRLNCAYLTRRNVRLKIKQSVDILRATNLIVSFVTIVSIGERGDAVLVLVIVTTYVRPVRLATDLFVVRNDGLAAVNVAVNIRARHAFHGLSIHRHITVPLRHHAVRIRLLSLVIERFQRVAPVDSLHGSLPSFVEHLPHLCDN